MTTLTATDVRTIVRDWTEALNHHDVDEVAGYLADDCLMVNHGTGERHEGRDAVCASFENLFAMFADIHFETLDILVDGDRWTKVWISSGTHTGELPGFPITGKPFQMHGAGVGRVRDGKIVEFAEYWNMAELLGHLGLMPTP